MKIKGSHFINILFYGIITYFLGGYLFDLSVNYINSLAEEEKDSWIETFLICFAAIQALSTFLSFINYDFKVDYNTITSNNHSWNYKNFFYSKRSKILGKAEKNYIRSLSIIIWVFYLKYLLACQADKLLNTKI